jgi:hypothetical protein
MRFPKLRHVILDECALGLDRVDARGCLWDIGKRCALAGVRRAKEREGKLKNWLETIALSEYPAVSQAVAVQGADVQRSSRPVRKGRRGLATATISLRASPPKHSTSSLPATSLSPKAKLAVPRVYILPSFPTLATFATTSSHIQPEIYRQISVDFEKGWADGLAQLSAIRQRRRQSWRNGMRVVRFRNENGNDDGDGLDGLVDLDSDEDGEVEVRSAPVLCLSGATRDEKAHVVGCGHSVWSAVLKDYAVAVV